MLTYFCWYLEQPVRLCSLFRHDASRSLCLKKLLGTCVIVTTDLYNVARKCVVYAEHQHWREEYGHECYRIWFGGVGGTVGYDGGS